jgi:aminopeptidase N
MQNTALRVPLTKPLAPGASVDVHLDFTVTIPRNSKQHYADFTADDNAVTMPSVYPLIPAYDAQGWHIEVPPPYGDLVYADVSLYAVTMTVPATMTVIASGSTIDTRDNGNGTTTWWMVGAPMRDFDLNVTDRLQKVSAVVGETTVNSYYEAADAEGGRNTLKYATDALRVFQDRFGAYPYRELDVIETSTTAGGIEYPGVVVIGRNLYSNPRQRDFFEFATAHEVSHQWWYGMVGNDQVNAPWVDESLAQYSTLIYYEDARGASAAQTILKNVFLDVYHHAKSTGRDAAVNQPVSAFNEPDYGAIVYGKGPLFYDALRKKMGNALFFKFLRMYFEQNRYRIATPEDILKVAEITCGCKLHDEYLQWILSPAPQGTPTR